MTAQRFALDALIGLLVLLIGCVSIAFGAETDNYSDEEERIIEYVSSTRATRTVMQSLSYAIDTFELDIMRYPTEAEGLKALLEDPGLKGWYGPYVEGENALVDAWGSPLKYNSQTIEAYSVISAGPDELFGTEDDIDASE